MKLLLGALMCVFVLTGTRAGAASLEHYGRVVSDFSYDTDSKQNAVEFRDLVLGLKTDFGKNWTGAVSMEASPFIETTYDPVTTKTTMNSIYAMRIREAFAKGQFNKMFGFRFGSIKLAGLKYTEIFDNHWWMANSRTLALGKYFDWGFGFQGKFMNDQICYDIAITNNTGYGELPSGHLKGVEYGVGYNPAGFKDFHFYFAGAADTQTKDSEYGIGLGLKNEQYQIASQVKKVKGGSYSVGLPLSYSVNKKFDVLARVVYTKPKTGDAGTSVLGGFSWTPAEKLYLIPAYFYEQAAITKAEVNKAQITMKYTF